jgi:hypothetical protein
MNASKKILSTILSVAALVLLKQPLFSNVGFFGIAEALLYYGDGGAVHVLFSGSAASDHVYAVYGAGWLLILRAVMAIMIVLQIFSIVSSWRKGSRGMVCLAGLSAFALGAISVLLAYTSNNTFALFEGGRYNGFFYEKPGAAAIGFLIVGFLQLILPFTAKKKGEDPKDVFDVINKGSK